MVSTQAFRACDVPPVRKSRFDSGILLNKNARSVTAAQWLSVPYWGFQPLGSSSILDGRATHCFGITKKDR